MNERTIFLQALEKRTAAERSAYLAATCGPDTALRQRVENLLQSHSAAGSFLGTPALRPDAADTQAPGPAAGTDDIALDFLAPATKPGALGRLDHYEVLDIVGRGGMGIVLRAFDEKLHRVVALKVMARDVAGSAAARKRFSREAKAAAAVVHDHIVPIHAIEETGPTPYLVMQFVEGQSLQQKIDAEGSLELKEILRIGLQIAGGLAAAHKQGLVHRDIKPSNILLENGVQRVKITDFGLARAVDDASVSQSGVIAGTPQYMSPEQADGRPVDHRSDLFSLGSVLYAVCTGRPPFRAAGTVATLKRVCDDTPRPIRELNPDLPDWLGDIIARLHAKTPAERFQSAQEVADLLERHLSQVQQASSLPSVPAERSAAPIVADDPFLANVRQRLRWPAIGLGITGILYWATIPVVFFAAFSDRVPDDVFAFLWVRLGLLPAFVGFVLILGAWKMRQLELYWLCLLASCLPFALLAEKLATLQSQRLTVTFGDWTALPFGMWAFIVLTSRAVRRAFQQLAQAPPTDTLRPTAVPSPVPPLAVTAESEYARRLRRIREKPPLLLFNLAILSLLVGILFVARLAEHSPDDLAPQFLGPGAAFGLALVWLVLLRFAVARWRGLTAAPARPKPSRSHWAVLAGLLVVAAAVAIWLRFSDGPTVLTGDPEDQRDDVSAQLARVRLQRLVTLQESFVDKTKQQYEAGVVPAAELTATQVELIEARIRLAEALRQPQDVARLLRELVEKREEQWRQAQALSAAGAIPQAEVDQAEKRLIEARLRAGLHERVP